MTGLINWRTLATLLLTASALLAWSFWLRRDTDNVKDTVTGTPRGYYLKDASMRQTGSNGDARYALHAQSIEQDPTNNHVNLAEVTLDYRSDTGATWQLSANHGTLDNEGNRASFAGHVLIQPTSQPDNSTKLTTDSLQVDMQEQVATTRDSVTLQMNQQHLTARGLKANLKEQVLRLESQVHGVFEVQSATSSLLP